MRIFKETSHLSEIIEESNTEPVIIFKFSSECNSSCRLYNKLEKEILDKTLKAPVYLVTVQKQPVLKEKIAEMFNIKHESPQILILIKGKVVYTAHHNSIKIEDFVFT